MVVLGLAVPLKNRVVRSAPWFGAAFVAAIAYADPGTFTTNFAAGATSGHLLVRVIVAANLMAMLILAERAGNDGCGRAARTAGGEIADRGRPDRTMVQTVT